MKVLARCIVLSITSILISFDLSAQSSNRDVSTSMMLPTVFKLGTHSDLYEHLRPGYESLLNACDGNMALAHQKLSGMMVELEVFAAKSGFDINGIKAWMHIFYQENGTIEYIGFHLKPSSKNVDNLEFGVILKNFSKQYVFPLISDKPYSHYSTFSFPVIRD